MAAQSVCLRRTARRHPGARILFLGVARNLTRHLAGLDFGPLIHSPVFTVPGLPNITVSLPCGSAGNAGAGAHNSNEAIVRRHVRKLARRLGMSRPILWLNPHSAVHLVGQMDESAVVYDITDDWISRPQPDWLAQQTRRQDHAMPKG